MDSTRKLDSRGPFLKVLDSNIEVQRENLAGKLNLLKLVPLLLLDTGNQHLTPFPQYYTKHRQQEVGSSSEIKFFHTKYTQK